jgi:quinol monooxygenase YgiN
MIITITTITVAPGKRDELLARAKAIVPKLRVQKGASDLQLLVDHPTLLQSMTPCRPDVITMIRKWDNEKNLAASFGENYLLDFLEQNRALIVDSQTRFLEPS